MKQYPYRLTERNISSLVSEYNNIYTGLLEQIDRCYLRLKEKSSAAEELEQQAIDAEKEAHDIYASFCSAEEITQALFFSEDQARSAMERAYCLDWDGEDAAAYADTMRANAHLAEEQLLHRKNIRINTQLEASKLEMQTAIAKAEAMISKLRFIIAAEEKTAMENKILQKEAQKRLRFIQKESLQTLADFFALIKETEAQAAPECSKIVPKQQSLQEKYFSHTEEEFNSIINDMLPYHKDLGLAAANDYKAASNYQKTLILAEAAEALLQQCTAHRQELENENEHSRKAADQKLALILQECEQEEISAKEALEYSKNQANRHKLIFDQDSSALEQIADRCQRLKKQKQEIQEELDKISMACGQMQTLQANSLAADRMRILSRSTARPCPDKNITQAISKLQTRSALLGSQLSLIGQELDEAFERMKESSLKERNSRKAYEYAQKLSADEEEKYILLLEALQEKRQKGQWEKDRIFATADNKMKEALLAEEESRVKVQRLAERSLRMEEAAKKAKEDRQKAEAEILNAHSLMYKLIAQADEEAQQRINEETAAEKELREQQQKEKARIIKEKNRLIRSLQTAYHLAELEQGYFSQMEKAAEKYTSAAEQARKDLLEMIAADDSEDHLERAARQLTDRQQAEDPITASLLEKAKKIGAELRALAENIINDAPAADEGPQSLHLTFSESGKEGILCADPQEPTIAKAAALLIERFAPREDAAEHKTAEEADNEAANVQISENAETKDSIFLAEEEEFADEADLGCIAEEQPDLFSAMSSEEIWLQQAKEESARIRAEEEAAQKAAEEAATIKEEAERKALEEARLLAISAAAQLEMDTKAEDAPAEEEVSGDKPDDLEQELRRLILSDMKEDK